MIISEDETSWCVTVEPIVIEFPLSLIKFNSSIPDISINVDGEANLCFIVGINVCPPARIFVSSFSLKSFSTSLIVLTFSYIKLYIFILLICCC